MNDETYLALGEFAMSLRDSQEYKLLKTLFEQQVAADLLTTGAKDTELREQLYHQLQGARAFHQHVEQYIELLEKLTAPEKRVPDADIDDPSVHNIYDEN